MKVELASPRKSVVPGGIAGSGDVGEPSASIFVGNLSWSVTEEMLRATFKDCGTINNVNMVQKKDGEITKWFKSNPQQLDGTGISIDQISTDHIIPKSVGGYDHLFNYYIMPKGHNSHFKDNWTPEKQAYAGKQGVKIAQGFSQWCKDKATPDLQFFNFNPDNYLL